MSAAKPAAAERVPVRWRMARLLDAPHRLCFFWAGLNWAGAAAWWAAHLLSDWLGAPWPWQLPAATAHGLWFTLGAMPLFIAGFMFTAGPKWLRRPPVAARGLRAMVGLFSLGWALALAGFHLGPVLCAVGLALVATGWAGLTWRIARLVAGSAQADRRHPRLILAACLIMGVGLILSSLAMATGRTALMPALLRLALWGGVAMVFLVVSHRLLPFLGDGAWPALDARWPDWPLWLVVSVPVVQSAGALVEPWCASLPGWRVAEAVHLGVVAVLCLWLSLRWTRARALRQPLVAMLYGAFLWWTVALGFGAAARLPGWAGSTAAALDMAAVHTLTMGYLGGTLLVMATRVSSAHSGRPLAIDRMARVLYGLLQLALLLRMVAAFTPSAQALWLACAAVAWMAVATAWTARHARWLGLPREDGRAS